MNELLVRDIDGAVDRIATGVLHDGDFTTSHLVLVETVEPGVFLVALDLSRRCNLQLLGRRVSLLQLADDGHVVTDRPVRVCAPTADDLIAHRRFDEQLFADGRAKPGPDLTVLRLEALPDSDR